MLIAYNESLMINHPIKISFVCDFQLNNKNSLNYTYLEGAWQCSNGCFSNNFLCQNACQ
jgi:hypothetical protein